MAKNPYCHAQIDLSTTVTFDSQDPVAAHVSHLATIDSRQHGLFTGWGGRPVWIGLKEIDTSGTGGQTVDIHARVPPNVLWFGVRILRSGSSEVKLTTSTDTNGCVFIGSSDSYEPTKPQSATYASALSFGMADTNIAGLARPLKVASSAAWDWQSVKITIATGSATKDQQGILWGVELIPIHRKTP